MKSATQSHLTSSQVPIVGIERETLPRVMNIPSQAVQATPNPHQAVKQNDPTIYSPCPARTRGCVCIESGGRFGGLDRGGVHLCGGVGIEAARWWCREIIIECKRGTFNIAELISVYEQ